MNNLLLHLSTKEVKTNGQICVKQYQYAEKEEESCYYGQI